MATLEELAVISLFTDTVLLDGEYLKYLYSLAEKLEGRPVYTHELPKIADKHRDELKTMVMDIYEKAKDRHMESVLEYCKNDVKVTEEAYENAIKSIKVVGDRNKESVNINE